MPMTIALPVTTARHHSDLSDIGKTPAQWLKQVDRLHPARGNDYGIEHGSPVRAKPVERCVVAKIPWYSDCQGDAPQPTFGSDVLQE